MYMELLQVLKLRIYCKTFYLGDIGKKYLSNYSNKYFLGKKKKKSLLL